MDLYSADQSAFKSDEVTKIVTQTVENVLKNESYDDVKVAQWVNDICEASIEKLAALKKPFKYAVTCCIHQRIGTALQSTTAQYWDSVSDGAVTVCWPKKNAREPVNNNVICIVTVFAASVYVS